MEWNRIKGQGDGNKDCARKHGMRLDLCYEMARIRSFRHKKRCPIVKFERA